MDHIRELYGSRGQADVAIERRRQVVVLGYSAHHDDQYQDGELLAAAAAYAFASLLAQHGASMESPPSWWPWPPEAFKPGGARRALVKASALLQAEIERFDRLNARVQAGLEQPSTRLVKP